MNDNDGSWDNNYEEAYNDLRYDEEEEDAADLTIIGKPKIVVMGQRRSGKSSILRVVFHKMPPHETLFLESTTSLDIKYIANNSFVQYQIWDFPGDFDLKEPLMYGGEAVTLETVFGNCSVLVFVIDAQDEPYRDAIQKLIETIATAHEINPNISFYIFIHKVDGELFPSIEQKSDCRRDIESQISDELADVGIDVNPSYFLTSIYDISILIAFSKVVQRLIPQFPVLENLMGMLLTNCFMEKVYFVDIISKIFMATDNNPMDDKTYELCTEMLDVLIDFSCIYGIQDESDEETDEIAYDSQSQAIIRLENGMILYLREASSYAAIACLIKSENFKKKGLIDYNINCFKNALSRIFKLPNEVENQEIQNA